MHPTEACISTFNAWLTHPSLHLYAQTIDTHNDGLDDTMQVKLGEGDKYKSDRRFEEMFKFLRAHPGPTLIYVALQAQAETHARVLRERGFIAAAFHAGMSMDQKKNIQDEFMASKIQIVS